MLTSGAPEEPTCTIDHFTTVNVTSILVTTPVILSTAVVNCAV
jgi:hypothetical protein